MTTDSIGSLGMTSKAISVKFFTPFSLREKSTTSEGTTSCYRGRPTSSWTLLENVHTYSRVILFSRTEYPILSFKKVPPNYPNSLRPI